ncbi:MAG: hypothetical protein ABIH35_00235 [Patescibacteria group bacterium]
MPKTKLFRPSEISLRSARLVFRQAEQPDWMKWDVDKLGNKKEKLLKEVEKQEVGRRISAEAREKIREQHAQIDFERMERSSLLYRRDGVGKAFEIQTPGGSKKYVHLKVTRAEALAIAEFVQGQVSNGGTIETALDTLGFNGSRLYREIVDKKEDVPTAKPWDKFVDDLPLEIRTLEDKSGKVAEFSTRLQEPSEDLDQLIADLESAKNDSPYQEWKSFIKGAIEYAEAKRSHRRIPAAVEVAESPTNGRFAVDKLMNEGAGRYESLLEMVYASSESSGEKTITFEVSSSKQFYKELKKHGKKVADIESIKRGRKDVTAKIKASPGKLWKGDVVSFKSESGEVSNLIPLDVRRLFGLSGKALDFTDHEAMKKFRRASTKEFEQKIDVAKGRHPDRIQELNELLTAFKVLDVSYGRVARGNSAERLEALNTSTKRGGAGSVKELFTKAIGLETSWNVFYYNFSKKKLGETPDKYKTAVENILRGEDTRVFMLRVDQETHGGKLEARIDQSDGNAWADNIDAPKYLREKENYTYKYLEVSDREKEAVLKKYLGRSDVAGDLDQYKVAQVEIPNCENPAIVVKREKQAEPVKALEFSRPLPGYRPTKGTVARVCGPSIAHMFKDHAPELFLPVRQEKFNEKRDPEIVKADGGVVRESEEVIASKVLDIKLKRQISGGVAQILGRANHAPDERYTYEDNEKQLEKWSEKNKAEFNTLLKGIKGSLDEVKPENYSGPEGAQKYLGKRMNEFFTWRKQKMDAVKEGKLFGGAFSNEVAAKKEILRMVEHALKYKIEDFSELSEKVKRENRAYELISYKEQHAKSLVNKKLGEFEKESNFGSRKTVLKILEEKNLTGNKNALVIDLIDQALGKLNIARKPIFVAKGVMIPRIAPGDRETLSVYRLIDRQKAISTPGSEFLKNFTKFAEIAQGGKWKSWEELAKSYVYKNLFKNPQEFKTFLNFVRSHSSEVCAAHYNLPTGKFQEVYEFFEAVAGPGGDGPDGCDATGGVDPGGSGPDKF